MADAQTITIKIPPALARGLRDPKSATRKSFSQAIEKSLIIAQGKVKKNITPGWGDGFRKGVFSGSLLRSVTYNMESPLKGILGVNKVYARIQEKGGVIVPRIKKMLAWFDKRSKTWHFAKKVTIKAKHYFKRGIQKSVPPIRRTLKKSVKDITRDMGFK